MVSGSTFPTIGVALEALKGERRVSAREQALASLQDGGHYIGPQAGKATRIHASGSVHPQEPFRRGIA